MMRKTVTAMVFATLYCSSALAATPDLVNGKRAFAACAACHGATGQGTPMAPMLKNVVGRKAGSIQGFNYSDAMRNTGISWTETQLSAFLLHPQQVVKGTRMAFPGLPSEKDRTDLIGYLKSLK
jgi:cytochrome c2